MKTIRKITLSALFLGLGIVLPFVTGQLQNIGNMLLPMHLPIFLCGLICGWKYGFATGFILPLFRSLLFTKPPMYPNAVVYAFELCTYGLVVGLVWMYMRKKNIASLYASILTAMLSGRFVWAMAKLVTMGLAGKSFTFEMFLSGAFVEAVPGIILQFILIPSIMTALDKSKILNVFDDK